MGGRGRTILHMTQDEATAHRLVRRSIARRAGEEGRIGVANRMIESAGLEAWL